VTSSDRDLDVVLYGATGFVGRLTADHLAQSAPDTARVALAGRSREKLEAVRSQLGPRAAGWPLLVADADDDAALADLAGRATAVATTVGPYAKYGMPLATACARAGTHYADLTGEVLFVRDVIDRLHDVATDSGARVVNACGFDSIPSDLGVLLLHERVQTDGAGELEDTTLVVERMRGGVSGGTIDSLRGQVDVMRTDKHKRRVALDPYSLSPDRDAEPDLGRQSDAARIGRDAELGGAWIAPFVMAPFNTRVVRRSNALQGWAYGRAFRYREVMSTGTSAASPVLAAASAAGIAGLAAGMALPVARPLLDRVLPKPGEGPSEDTRRKGHFRVRVHGRTSTGARYSSVVAASGDPGYAATAVMLGQSALCLALDGDRLPRRAGVLTPATAMGTALADRLRAQGFTLEVSRA
jgi:short subunit dehydrogenase-like uncharacterized protein